MCWQPGRQIFLMDAFNDIGIGITVSVYSSFYIPLDGACLSNWNTGGSGVSFLSNGTYKNGMSRGGKKDR